MTLKKILWPTDFSDSAERALSYINRMSEEHGAEVHVLYVIEDVYNTDDISGDFNENHLRKLKEWADEVTVKHLDRICCSISGEPDNYVRHTAIGIPADEILNLIHTEKPDMIVMSCRGQYGEVKAGSTSEKVIKHSPVPVTTIPLSPI